MKTRLFNGTKRQVSEVGLGCWQLGGSDWGDLDDEAAFAILTAAVEAGVTFFDTADVYGDGRSESLIGQFLRQRGPAADIFVATKLGRTGSLYPDQYTEAGVRTATEASLRRLGVEALDLTQLHCVPAEVLRRREIFEWLRKLQTEGKIKHFGASVETMDEALLCLDEEGVSSLQVIFNLFRQKPAEIVLPRARKQGVAIIVRLPLASGLLSGKLTREAHFAANDHRHYNRDGEKFNVGETFAGLPYEKGVVLAEALRASVPSGQTMAQWSQRWILDHEAVTVIIPGASRAQQATDNAAASGLPPLSTEAHRELRRFYEDEVAAHIRGPY
jgi:aryl-alcohol dehydrogenase-like predicted oxidoreductase